MKYCYELILKGFDGGTDATDHLIVWVESDLPQPQFVSWLHSSGLHVDPGISDVRSWNTLPDGFDVDFVVPNQEDDLKARIVELLAQPVDLSQVTACEEFNGVKRVAAAGISL